MRLSKFLKLASIAMLLSGFLFSCKQPENKDKKIETPALTLSYLKLFEEEATDLNAPQFSVASSVTTIISDNIVAKFNYGSKTNEKLSVSVAYKDGATSLKEGENKLTLSVVAEEGKYKAWSKEITVKRAKSKVTLKPISLKVKTSSTPIKWDFAIKSGNDFIIEVPTSIASIEKADIEAYFEWDGMQNPKPRKVDFNVEGNFPIQLEAPGTAKVINMTVPEDLNGEYLEFINKVTITRKKLDEIQLKKIKLVSKTFTKKEITEFDTTPEVIETDSQFINVFFYSKTDGIQEDVELLKKITTEPELKKNGAVKTWELNNVNNELKVKVDGNLIYTVKVKRKPLLVESIGIYGNNETISVDAEEGQIYNTVASSIAIAVIPKQINSGYLVYKDVKVKAGNANEVTLAQNDPNDQAQGFSGLINLTEESTQITVTVTDPTDKDEFKLTRIFTIKKESSNPSTGPIDPSVQIAELWIGDGNMDSLNINKFKAEKDVNDEHKYKVYVSKKYNGQKVSLIVKGDGSAISADIKDGTAANSVKADGVAKFESTKTYIDVRGNSKKYIFMLENGSKKAQYEVTCVFNVAPKFTITITQPEHGIIKVYQTEKGERKDLTISASGTVEIEEGKAVYFELIAKDGKKPKKLVVDGVEHIKVTSVIAKQTPGAIAVRIDKVKNNFSVTGECGE